MRHTVTLLSLVLATACGGRQRADQVPQGLSPRGDQAATQGQDPAGAVVGAWAVRAVNRERTGRQLQIILDSARGQSFQSRVGFLMQGDVGIDPAEFVSTVGSVSVDGAIRIEIRNRRGAPPGLIVGRVAGDTIHVAEFRWAGEDQLAGGTKWALVRERN